MDLPVYVDMGLAYNNPLTLTVVTSGTSMASRSFSMKVNQIECGSLQLGKKYFILGLDQLRSLLMGPMLSRVTPFHAPFKKKLAVNPLIISLKNAFY